MLLAKLLQGLYEGEVPRLDEAASKLCLNQLTDQGVFSQMYHLLSLRSRKHPIPEQFMSTLKGHYMHTLGQNLFVRRHEDVILDAFEAAQIEVIPLKGTRFAERFFGHIGARPTSDIDILIHLEDAEQVYALLQSLGYSKPEPFNPRHYHCMVRKETNRGELIVEIHWAIVKQYTSNLDIDTAWNQSRPADSFHYVRELSVPYTFYSICLHGANHNMASLKPYLDIVQMLYSNGTEISYSWLYHQSKCDQTFRRVKSVLQWVYQMFPALNTSKPLGPFHARGRRGRFGLSQYDSVTHRILVMKDWLWPRSDIARWFLQVPYDVPAYRLYPTLYYRRIRKAIQMLSQSRGAQLLLSKSSGPDQTG